MSRDNRRVVYQPAPDSADPLMDYVQVAPEDGHTLYLRSTDAEGRASFWSLPVSGGSPAHLFTGEKAGDGLVEKGAIVGFPPVWRTVCAAVVA